MYSLIPTFYHCFYLFSPPQGAGYLPQGNKNRPKPLAKKDGTMYSGGGAKFSLK
jgi:hypothetical protein